MIWDMWKQGFAAWEQATAQYMEKVLTNPGVLGPARAMLTAAMKTKAATDKALASWWGARAVVGEKRGLAVAIAAALSVAPAFVFRGDGFDGKKSYNDHANTAPLFRFIRKLPLDATIAGDGYITEVIYW